MAVGEEDSRARIQRKALWGEEDASLVFETSKEVDVVPTFDQMNIGEELLRGIYAYGKRDGVEKVLTMISMKRGCFASGFEKPSAIQQRAIVPVVKGRDVVVIAQ